MSTLSDKRANLSDVELRQVRVFVAVAECGGITAAELILNKGKSSISADVTDLEQRMNMSLFQSKRGDFRLTNQGRAVYEAAKQLLNNVDLFQQEVHKAQNNLTGRLKLYVADNSVWDHQLQLDRLIALYHEAFPNVHLSVVGAGPDDVPQAVLSGRADLGINVMPRTSDALVCTQLYQEDLFLYCGSDHPLFRTPLNQLTMEKLKEAEFVEVVTLHNQDLEAMLSECTMAASASTLDARAAMILSGKYVGFLPGYMARHWLKQERMRALLPELMYTTNNVYAIASKATPSHPARDGFVSVLLRHIKQLVPTPIGRSARTN